MANFETSVEPGTVNVPSEPAKPPKPANAPQVRVREMPKPREEPIVQRNIAAPKKKERPRDQRVITPRTKAEQEAGRRILRERYGVE